MELEDILKQSVVGFEWPSSYWLLPLSFSSLMKFRSECPQEARTVILGSRSIGLNGKKQVYVKGLGPDKPEGK